MCLPASAHSSGEIEAWTADWYRRYDLAITQSDQPTGRNLADLGGLLAELADFQGRHPEHYDPSWAPPRSVANDRPRASRAMGSNVDQWRPLVAAYFDASEVETALCIMSKESGGNPSAKNPTSTAAGLFQFLRGTWDGVPSSLTGGSYASGAVYQAEANIRSAAWLQDQYGWSPWSPWNRGLCRGL